jgi:plastocyanin
MPGKSGTLHLSPPLVLRGRVRVGAVLLAAMLLVILPLHLQADAPSNATVSINNGFNPATIMIHPGDTVTWTNDDDRDHDVTANDNSFFSGNLKPGKTFSYKFTTVGRFLYGCSLHPRERGTIIVGK